MCHCDILIYHKQYSKGPYYHLTTIRRTKIGGQLSMAGKGVHNFIVKIQINYIPSSIPRTLFSIINPDEVALQTKLDYLQFHKPVMYLSL